jgi:hypothetical protein
MWYINNSNDRFGTNVNESKLSIAYTNIPPFINYGKPETKYKPPAGYHIKQIDDKYIGAYNGSDLLMVIPSTFHGVKLDPKLITGATWTKDSYEFNYPDTSGKGNRYFGRIDQEGITSEYSFKDLSNKVVRTDLRADFNRMKEQEQKLNSMYFQFVTLANNFVKQGFSKNKIKEDLYFRILNLVQTGQIDEQSGMTLNSWLGKLESLDTSEPKTQEEKDLDASELKYEGEAAFNEYNQEIKDPGIDRNVLLNEINANRFMTEKQKQELRDKIN